MITKLAISLLIVALSSTVSATTYECRAEWAARLVENASDGLTPIPNSVTKQSQNKLRIIDGDSVILERCMFIESQNKYNCIPFEIDVVSKDKYIESRKYYNTRTQYDIQLLTLQSEKIIYVENNGRGGIATGFCNVIDK